MTNLLLDKLKDSTPSRIINLASVAHVSGEVDFDDLNWDRRKFDTRKAYSQSKLALVLFTRELAKRLEGMSGCVTEQIHMQHQQKHQYVYIYITFVSVLCMSDLVCRYQGYC